MPLNQEKIRAETGGATIADLQSIPASSFSDLLERIVSGQWQLGIDISVARSLAPHITGRIGTIYNTILMISPYISVILISIWAITSKSWLSLLGLPLSFFAFLLGVPNNPAKGFATKTLWIAIIAGIIFCYLRIFSAMLILYYYIVPMVLIRHFYRSADSIVRKECLKNEDLFVFLYEAEKIRILNTQTGDIYRSSSTNIQMA